MASNVEKQKNCEGYGRKRYQSASRQYTTLLFEELGRTAKPSIGIAGRTSPFDTDIFVIHSRHVTAVPVC
jgi:hypothetical protein